MKSTMKIAFATMMVVASSVMTTVAVAADNPTNEITGSTNAALTFGSGQNTKFSVATGYNRTLMDILQAGGQVSFSTETGATTLTALVGPTLNIALDDTGIRNAVYVAAQAGIAYVKTTASATEFAYGAAVGKRFELWTNIVWKPEFSVAGTTATGSDPRFSFTPAQFAFFY